MFKTPLVMSLVASIAFASAFVGSARADMDHGMMMKHHMTMKQKMMMKKKMMMKHKMMTKHDM